MEKTESRAAQLAKKHHERLFGKKEEKQPNKLESRARELSRKYHQERYGKPR